MHVACFIYSEESAGILNGNLLLAVPGQKACSWKATQPKHAASPVPNTDNRSTNPQLHFSDRAARICPVE
jgi:hypothetical protein